MNSIFDNITFLYIALATVGVYAIIKVLSTGYKKMSFKDQVRYEIKQTKIQNHKELIDGPLFGRMSGILNGEFLTVAFSIFLIIGWMKGPDNPAITTLENHLFQVVGVALLGAAIWSSNKKLKQRWSERPKRKLPDVINVAVSSIFLIGLWVVVYIQAR